MAASNKPLGWLPLILIAGGLFFLMAGLLSDGPDRVGGIVFGVVSLAAAAAILYRHAREVGKAQSFGGPPASGTSNGSDERST